MQRGAIWVVGEALVDQLPSGPVPGGAPFNVARSLARLGQPVRFVSRTGTDDQGARLIHASAYRFQLPTDLIQADADHPTGVVQVMVQAGGGHRFQIADNSAWDHIDATTALQALHGAQPELLYFGTLAQRHSISRSAIRQLVAQSACCYLDLNVREGPDNRSLAQDSLALAHWVKVNDEELAQLMAWFTPDGHIKSLMQQFKLHRLIVTRGSAGYDCWDVQGQCLAQGPGSPLAQLADTVGAGDAFSAMFIAAHHRGVALAPALALANAYAAWVCTVHGPLPADANALQDWQARLLAQPTEPKEVSPWRV